MEGERNGQRLIAQGAAQGVPLQIHADGEGVAAGAPRPGCPLPLIGEFTTAISPVAVAAKNCWMILMGSDGSLTRRKRRHHLPSFRRLSLLWSGND